MSENENTPAPFMPFVPPGSAPPTQPDGGPIENKPAKPPRKSSKKKTPTQKQFATAVASPTAELAKAALAAPPRKRRKVGKHPALVAPYGKGAKLPKYDLQTILRVAATLHEADQAVFEKLLGELTALAKGSRERVLKALGDVFG